MLVLASSTLDANAIPAFILIGLMLCYAGVGVVMQARSINSAALPDMTRGVTAGLGMGLLAGIYVALAFDLLVFAFTHQPLDGPSLLVSLLEVAVAYGLGIGAGLFLRRRQLREQAPPAIAWDGLLAATNAFSGALIFLVVFIGITADAAVLGICLLAGLLTGWPAGGRAGSLPQEALQQLQARNTLTATVIGAIIGGLYGLGAAQPLHGPPVVSQSTVAVVIGAIVGALFVQFSQRAQRLVYTLAERGQQMPLLAQRWASLAGLATIVLGLAVATMPLWAPRIGIPIQ